MQIAAYGDMAVSRASRLLLGRQTLASAGMSVFRMHEGGVAGGSEPARWIAAIAACGDRGAFAQLFGYYAPRIKAMLMRAGASAEAAEEFAQEAMLTVWRKAASYDPARASAAAWIFTIARNLRIDAIRRESRAKAFDLDDPDEPAQPDGILDASQREARVRAALRTLPAEQMRVIELSFFEGRPHSEIAQRLGVPLGTVKSRLRLAANRLRGVLDDLS